MPYGYRIKWIAAAIIASICSGCVSVAESRAKEFLATHAVQFERIPAIDRDARARTYSSCEDELPKLKNAISIQELDTSKTRAFAIYAGDKVRCVYFGEATGPESLLDSWSISKSIVSLLVGIAIEDARISSIDEPITQYIPELIAVNPKYKDISLKNLLEMRSGILFREDYFSMSSDLTRMMSSADLLSFIGSINELEAPDQRFDYQSFNYLLLSIAIERATRKPLAEFASERLWTAIGSRRDAFWLTDASKSRTTFGFCCFRAVLDDYINLSVFLLDSWEKDKSIFPKDWLRESMQQPRAENNFSYGLGWWHENTSVAGTKGIRYQKGQAFGAEGVMGQFIYINPTRHIAVLRFGESRGKVDWVKKFGQIAEAVGTP